GCQQGLLWDPYSNISNFAITLECYSHNDTARLTSSNYNGNLNEACLLNFALDEQDFFPARLYPNPGHNNVTLDISDYTGPMELKIFSTSGQELFAQVITQANTTIQHDLPEGIYMVVGFYRGRSFVRKMVVTE
ncbi:MAG: T9SS type A sorting domain-containing protein, partial [Owenweeksia sp.]